MNKDIRELIYDKYIYPIEGNKKNLVGVEIELPIVNRAGLATDHNVSKAMFASLIDHFGLRPVKYDLEGSCHEAISPVTGDGLSFDCSYNNFEISFGTEESLVVIEQRFREYITYANEQLLKYNHIITGMGIQPYYYNCNKNYVPNGRYKMLEGFLRKGGKWGDECYFHNYPEYGTYASASQVQLDVSKDELIKTIQVFSKLEPLKSIIFANSVMLKDEPDLLCVRDMLWENSSHGINAHNIGMYEEVPNSIDEFIEYIAYTSIFCNERDGDYLFFHPTVVSEYFNKGLLEGEYYKDGEYLKKTFEPEKKDIEYLRTYKFLDLTKRGTIEYRSLCTQPLKETFSGIALQVGLMSRIDELDEILSNDKVLYHHGFTAPELRRMLNHEQIPDFIDKDGLRVLLEKIIDLSESGLVSRGFGEEKFLDKVQLRADTLTSPAREMKNQLRKGVSLSDIVDEYANLA